MTRDFQKCGMCDQQSFRSACAYAQSDQSLCWSLKYSMTVKLLTEHHLEFLSLKEGCTGSSESTLVKMSNCWKSHTAAHFISVFTVCHSIWLQVSRMKKVNWPLVKSACQIINFLNFQPKRMLWVLKRTVSMRLSFWAPKSYVQNYAQTFHLSKPMVKRN